MIQAQIQRDTARKELTREEFLLSLALRCKMIAIESTSDSRFPRSLELINKTNQFNTTGRRWKAEECERAFSEGAVFHAFEYKTALLIMDLWASSSLRDAPSSSS